MSFTKHLTVRRKVLLGTAITAMVLVQAMASMSCVTLPDIEANSCGNRVVEPDRGEACDSAAEEENTQCGEPNEYGACRYICAFDSTSDTSIGCPTGQGCGLDGICRLSGGLDSTPISIGGGGTRQLLKGDFDGDLQTDIVAIGDSTVNIHYLNADGFVDRTVSVPNDRGIPGVGDIDGDGLTDLALNLGKSIGVMLGRDDRSLVPQAFPTVVARKGTKRLVPLELFETDSALLAFAEDDGPSIAVDTIFMLPDGGHIRKDHDGPTIPGTLVGTVGMATIDIPGEPLGCPLVAFEVAKPPGLPLLKDRLYIANCKSVTLDPDSSLGEASAWAGAFFVDVDDDGYEDLVFGQSLVGSKSLRVRHYDPVGLTLDPPTMLLTVTDDACVNNLASAPLAIGDINLDNYPDFIDSRGILFSAGPAQYERACNNDGRWGQAVLGDINGDGLQDLIASRLQEAVIDIWQPMPDGYLNTFSVAVDGPIAELVGGDFDGDQVFDVAFRLGTPGENTGMMMNPGEIFAIFGEPLAVPTPPTMLGFVDNPLNLVAGRIKGDNALGMPDPLTDLLILSRSMHPQATTEDAHRLTLIQGNATRNMLSPLTIKSTIAAEEPDKGGDYQILGLLVSNFAASQCQMSLPPTDDPEEIRTPSSIAAFTSTAQIWLAGCENNGSSISALNSTIDPITLPKSAAIVAPVNKDEFDDSLAIFIRQENDESSLGVLDGINASFNLEYTSANLRLSQRGAIDVPFVYADMNNDGRRDVVLTGYSTKSDTKGAVYIFWNTATDGNLVKLDPADYTEYAVETIGNQQMSAYPIVDIAVLNLDEDLFKEIAILTQDEIQFAKLTLEPKANEEDAPTLTSPHTLEVFNVDGFGGDYRSARIRGANALLAIDANSDGLDDLITADAGKLQLFLGKERFQ